MPDRNKRSDNVDTGTEAAPVRSFWSGTITFGLVSIPVDLFSAARARQKSMKLVDKEGHALGRQYRCSEDGKELAADEIVRGYETDSGEIVVVTDAELEAVAPEKSWDIELQQFVPLGQIPPIYFERPYFLAPSGRSVRAYHLLARTMEKTDRVAIGRFVMRGHEYMVAILSENGVLRAETLRYAEEIRTPEQIGLPARRKPPEEAVRKLAGEIKRLTQTRLDMTELEDQEADELRELAEAKLKKGQDVIGQPELEDEETEGGGAQIIDLMEVLKKSLSKKAVVKTADATESGTQRGRKTGRDRSAGSGTRTPPEEELAEAPKSELYKIAADLDIAGRSKMDKSELVEAIQKAG
ncbi:MAG TPA: Ku protein [Steroidobacteraceae bacterium]|nr:Ku protein [Steroidobacteraceae bacterium]